MQIRKDSCQAYVRVRRARWNGSVAVHSFGEKLTIWTQKIPELSHVQENSQLPPQNQDLKNSGSCKSSLGGNRAGSCALLEHPPPPYSGLTLWLLQLPGPYRYSVSKPYNDIVPAIWYQVVQIPDNSKLQNAN